MSPPPKRATAPHNRVWDALRRWRRWCRNGGTRATICTFSFTVARRQLLPPGEARARRTQTRLPIGMYTHYAAIGATIQRRKRLRSLGLRTAVIIIRPTTAPWQRPAVAKSVSRDPFDFRPSRPIPSVCLPCHRYYQPTMSR